MDAANGSFLDHALTTANLRRALRRVVANAGTPGVDGETVLALAAREDAVVAALAESLKSGDYAPAPLRLVAVPKPEGRGVRTLGIPTVRDRLAQHALAQALGALLDPTFSPYSFGFRPGRGAHDALAQAAAYVAEGRRWVLHLDLEKFFDRAPHDLVLARLRGRVADERLVDLVERFLRAPFACGRRLVARERGLPQGGPLSPLLANLLLDGFDRRLFDAGFAFCRYADDICLYCESAAEAREALAMVAPWLENDLRLPLNRRKTRIVPVERDVFLGHRMCWRAGRVEFGVSADARERLRRAVRRLLAADRTGNPGEVLGMRLSALLRGWFGYFRLAIDGRLRAALDRWVMGEVRHWLWRRARDPRRRARELIRRGVPVATAWRLFALPDRIAINTAAFRRAYPVGWLRSRGWRACGELLTERPVKGDEAVAALRVAARECGFYLAPWTWLSSATVGGGVAFIT